jgi:hypothetical protein
MTLPTTRLGRLATRARQDVGGRVVGLAAAVFVLTAALLGVRLSTRFVLPGETDLAHWGMRDFRDNVHRPVAGFLAGENPYDAARIRREDPARPPFGPYAPSTLLVHLPLGLVQFRTGAVLWFLLTLALTLALARLALLHAGLPATAAGVIALGTLLLWSRPGHWNLLLGQLAAELSVAAIVALLWARRRPALAGAALAVTTLKPSFGLPLAVVMLARRDLKALLVGVAITLALNGISVAVLVGEAGGVRPFVASVMDTLDDFRVNPGNEPSNNTFRIDLTALIARQLGHAPSPLATAGIAIGVLGVAAFALDRVRRWRDREAAEQLGIAVAGLATLLWFYHMGYDALLLVPSLVALAAGRRRPWSTSPRVRIALAVLLAVPMVNYLATGTGIDWLGLSGGTRLITTSINGAALAAAFALVVALALQHEE